MKNRLTGFNIRKALELELSIEQIFQIDIEEDGNIAAQEIFEEGITHTSEIDNFDEIFKDNEVLFYTSPKKEVQINDSLKAYHYNFYMVTLLEKENEDNSLIYSEKHEEIMFLNTNELSFIDFCQNTMDANFYLGKFSKNIFNRKFLGIGQFNMEDYSLIHPMFIHSNLHLLDFYIMENEIITTISNMISANYGNDIEEQRSYLKDDKYIELKESLKKHKKILKESLGFNFDVD